MPGSSSFSIRSRGSILPWRASRSRSRCGRSCRAASCFSRNSRGERAIVRGVGAELRARGADHRLDAVHRIRSVSPAAVRVRATISSLSKVSPTPRVQLGERPVARREQRRSATSCSRSSPASRRARPRRRAACEFRSRCPASARARGRGRRAAPRPHRAGSTRLASKVRPSRRTICRSPTCARAKSMRRPSISIVWRPSSPSSAAVNLVFAAVDAQPQMRAAARRSRPRGRRRRDRC